MADPRLRNRSTEAIFLCYHSIALEGSKYLTVSPSLFERQLAVCEGRGLRSGDLASLEAIAAGRPSPPTMFLTFDDGFIDNYETVMPILRERGMQAFVFVLPPLVDEGAPLAWPELLEDSKKFPDAMRSVTWSMLGEMKEGPFEVGAHTLTHPHLPDLDPERLKQEMWESRVRVKEELGSCDTFAYPFGEWNDAVASCAAECGYRFAFTLPTVRGQYSATPLTIPRVNVDYRDDGARLASKLSTGGRRLRLSNVFKAGHRAAKRVASARPRR